MKQHYFRTVAYCISLLVPSVALAQVSECAQLLMYAGETFSSHTDEARFDSMADWFCEHEFSSASDARNFASGAKFPIEGFPFEGFLNGGDSSVRNSQRDFCSASRQ